jgi:hypothetical protein
MVFNRPGRVAGVARNDREEAEDLAEALRVSLCISTPPAAEAQAEGSDVSERPKSASQSAAEPLPEKREEGAAGSSHTTVAVTVCITEARQQQASPPHGTRTALGRAYAVWDIPGCTAGDYTGVHSGKKAWAFIEGLIPGRSYRRGIDHLRAFPSVAEAKAAYEAEAPKHGSTLPVREWRWE